MVSGTTKWEVPVIAMCDARTGEPLLKAGGPSGPQMQRVDLDLSEFVGREVFLQIVDRHTGSWGHLTFDDFSVEGEITQAAHAR